MCLAPGLLIGPPMLGIRWTIGNVSRRGFEALRLSIWGACKVFGPRASYMVSVNSLPVSTVRELTGPLPDAVEWRSCDTLVPTWLYTSFLDQGMAQGVAWKFAPLRCFPDRREIMLDNDVVLWDMPESVAAWMSDEHTERCLIAEDVVPSFGQFASLCGARPLNTGIRGLPAGFDLEARLRDVLTRHPVKLVSELDEQGLQSAALSLTTPPHVVTVQEVTICSPFPPHVPELGRSGAHFVGLNARRLGWDYHGEPAERVRARHWDDHRAELYARVGITRHLVHDWVSGEPV